MAAITCKVVCIYVLKSHLIFKKWVFGYPYLFSSNATFYLKSGVRIRTNDLLVAIFFFYRDGLTRVWTENLFNFNNSVFLNRNGFIYELRTHLDWILTKYLWTENSFFVFFDSYGLSAPERIPMLIFLVTFVVFVVLIIVVVVYIMWRKNATGEREEDISNQNHDLQNPIWSKQVFSKVIWQIWSNQNHDL